MTSIDHLQTLENVAAVLRLSPATLKGWARQGRIHGHALDGALWSDLLDFSAARPATYYRPSEVLSQATRRGGERGQTQ